jgi:EF-P beta-lysylation protein EpmB
MIPGSTTIVHSSDWQRELADGFKQPLELLRSLDIDPALIPDLDTNASDFPQRVPRAFASRMERGNTHDPLLRQVLPLRQEQIITAGFSADPLQEAIASRAPGIIHKYHGRVLLITTGACAVHCRYCFRRHFPYQAHSRSTQQWHESLQYIRQDSSISEVILSGGDPLLLSDERLQTLITALDAIPHLKRLRIHSRLPIVLPNRMTSDLLHVLSSSRLRRSLVVHCNHPHELDQHVADKLELLASSGTTLFNQAVLLRGVNDDTDTLIALSESLFAHGVLPYYLHLLDPVAGSAHFDLDESRARQLYRQLLERPPGYLVPKLVRETPSLRYKNPISPY